MRLRTIWTLPGMAMMERLRRTSDLLDLTVARKLPKRVRYWAVMVALGKVTTTGPFAARHPMGLTADEFLKAMEKTEKVPRS